MRKKQEIQKEINTLTVNIGRLNLEIQELGAEYDSTRNNRIKIQIEAKLEQLYDLNKRITVLEQELTDAFE